MLTREFGTTLARSHEWEAAFVLVFGQRAFEEAYPCIDWASPRYEWAGDAAKFADAFSTADAFAAFVMHRLFPFQYREMIPALTHALMSWSWQRVCPPASINFKNCRKYFRTFSDKMIARNCKRLQY